MELRSCVSVIFNELLTIAKIPAEFTINNFQVIDESIVELEGDASRINNLISAMHPTVAQKILDNMTADEIRALADLPPLNNTPV